MKYIICILFGFTYIGATTHIVTKEFHIEKPVKSWIEFKNDNLTRQDYDYSCGASSLATIMKYYYDQNVTEKVILDEILSSKGLNKDNMKDLEEKDMSLSFLDLSKYVETKKFKAIGLAIDFDGLENLKIPVILYVKIRKNEHFTVFKGIDEDYVYLADPSFGNTKVKISKFKEMFLQRDDDKYGGKILAILPTQKIINSKNDFMNVKNSSNLVYDVIMSKALKQH
ncbi:MAG: hypothetical protein KN64_05015 [Sulfurovum sp. AS07-7]|nr:MAG: hypothetical protein KN64_05015 [Sulfurovum sp. AS07-7]